MKDLIWIQTGFIGDIILTTAAISLASQYLPGVRQHVITTPQGVSALEGSDHIHSLIPFEKNLLDFKKIKQMVLSQIDHPDHATILQVHRSYRSSFLAKYIGIKTITYQETDAGWLADQQLSRVAVFHEAHRIAILLEALGIERKRITSAKPKLAALEMDDKTQWQKTIKNTHQPLIGIAPGSIWGTKRWPIESYSELVELLLKKADYTIILLGSKKELPLTTKIVTANYHSNRILDLAGKTNLSDLRRIFPRLSLLVSNDSSPLHFASAFNVPSVGIFGATIPEMGFGPLSYNSDVVGVSNLKCRPCSSHGPEICPLEHFSCMRKLEVKTVYNSCVKLLDAQTIVNM